VETSAPRPSVSATDPISRAVELTTKYLFSRPSARVWFGAGLAAFLQQCSRGMGSGGSFRGFNFPGGGGAGPTGMDEAIAKAQTFVDQWLALIVVGIVLLFLLMLGLKLLLDWLGSRGDFMLLDMIARGHAAVEQSWHEFAAQANSLFRLRAVLAVVSFAVSGLFLALLAMPALADLKAGALSGRTIGAAIFLGILATLAFLALGLVAFFVNNVVMPIMYARRCDARVAWREGAGLLRAHPGQFLLFLAVRIGMVIVGGIAVVLVGCLSQCLCVGCIPFAGQYLVIVGTLPVWVAMQAYSAYFIEQFGPDYAMMDRWPDDGSGLLPVTPVQGAPGAPSAPLPPGFGGTE